MATRKTASKTSKKATINFNWNKPNKKETKKAEKQLKKLSIGGTLALILMLGFGAVGGFFGVKFLTRNDCFVLNGADEITIQLDDRYVDQGAKVVAFNRDESEDIEIETNLKVDENGYYAEEVGTYYMVYKSKNIKYNSLFKVQKIRLITVVEASEGDNYEE